MPRRRSKGLDIHGIFLLNKPLGLSSNAALQKVRRLYNANKAGHTGSLDPLATGLLPICLGEATKVSSYLLDSVKSYRAVCKLGVVTSTGDLEGEVISQNPLPDALSLERIKGVFASFLGEIMQIPPMYSALKKQGVPLYKLARQGQEVEREARPVTIYDLQLIEWQGDELTFQVSCSKGTYVRTLAEDIGVALGCGGAHLTALHRTAVGGLDGASMLSLEELEALISDSPQSALEKLVAVDQAILSWPEVTLNVEQSDRFRHGQAVAPESLPDTEGPIRVYDSNKSFFAIGQIGAEGKIVPKRLFHL